MIENIILSLIATIIIETTIVYLIGAVKRKSIIRVILINCITNLSINIITDILLSIFESVYIIVLVLLTLEIINIFVEAFLLKKFVEEIKSKYLLISMCTNITSFLIGFVIQFIISI